MSVRITKSKREKYRVAIKKFMKVKFATESTTERFVSKTNISKKKVNGYQRFEENLKELEKEE
ncbi:MAG: hypothetical protein ACFFCV_06470 [Promethearchaeota archaeon]